MSQMRGLSSDIIEVLRVNLNNYTYGDGFSVLKELIQNASDANATKLTIAYYEGNPNAKHPLLKLPGVMAYNDGGFDEKDGKGISSIGGANKRNDGSTIGKYGLGLKSVFHICNAFFYYAFFDGVLNGVNPFYGRDENPHADWDQIDLESDTESFRKEIDRIFDKPKDGLVLYFPIDVKESNTVVSAQTVLNVEHPFNADDDEDDSRLIKNVVSALLMVAKTKKENAERKFLSKFCYKLKDKTITISLPKTTKSMSLEIDSEKGKETFEMPFTELRVSDFSKVELSEGKRNVVERTKQELAKFEKKDKILNEEEIVFELVRIPTRAKKSSINFIFAVYLPLPEQKGISSGVPFDEEQPYDYFVVIHAPFAIDSGRKKIFSFEKCRFEIAENTFEDENSNYEVLGNLHILWNKILYQYFVMPSMLQLVKKSIDAGVVGMEAAFHIMKFIVGGLFVDKDFKKSSLDIIFSQKILCLQYDKAKNWEKGWSLQSSRDAEGQLSISCVMIPELPYEGKADLMNLAPSGLFLSKKMRDLEPYALNKCGPCSYRCDIKSCAKILMHLPTDLLCKKENIKFFTDFVDSNFKMGLACNFTDLERDSLRIRLFDILKKCDRGIYRDCSKDVEVLFRTLKAVGISVSFIPGELLQGDEWLAVWSKDNPHVFIPYFGEQTCERVHIKAAFFGFLEKCGLSDEARYRLLKNITDDWAGNVRTIKQNFDKLKIFRLKDVSKRAEVFVGYDKIRDAAVFKDFNLDDASHLVLKIKSVFLDVSIYTADSDRIREYDLTNVYDIDKMSCLRALKSFYKSKTSQTKDEDTKENLYRSIFDQDFEKADVGDFGTDFVKFLVSRFSGLTNQHRLCVYEDISDLWIDIYKTCVTRSNSYIVPIRANKNPYLRGFVKKNVPEVQWVNEQRALMELKAFAESNSLECLGTFAKDRFDILKRVGEFDRELCYKLPFHKNAMGDLVAFVSGAMWYNKYEINLKVFKEEWKKCIILKEPEIGNLQNQLFDINSSRTRYEILSHAKALQIFFGQNPDFDRVLKNYEWIHERMLMTGHFSKDEIAIIAAYKWIPRNNILYAFNDILPAEKFESGTCTKLSNDLKFIFADTLTVEYAKDDFERFVKNPSYDFAESFKASLRKRLIESKMDGYIPFAEGEENLWKAALSELSSWNGLLGVFKSLYDDKKHLLDKFELFGLYCSLKDELSCSFDMARSLADWITTVDHTPEREDLFRSLLEIIVQDENFVAGDLKKYPVQSGKWIDSSFIVAERPENAERVATISEDCIMEERCMKLIHESLPLSYKLPDRVASKEDAGLIAQSWYEHCENKLLCKLVLYLLQGDFREIMGGRLEGVAKEKLDACFPETQVKNIVKVNLGDVKFVHDQNLLGDYVDFPHRKGCIGSCDFEKSLTLQGLGDNKYVLNATFFEATETIANEELEVLLKKLLKFVCMFDPEGSDDNRANYSALFGTICNRNQYTVNAALREIELDLFKTLKQLGLKHPIYKDLDGRRSKIAGAENISDADRDRNISELNHELVAKVKTDVEFRKCIFDCVKANIEKHQYDSPSVLFELLQNADDCVNDYRVAGENIEDKRRFEISFDESVRTITVTHYGRKINEPVGTKHRETHIHDLVNMLSMLCSNKEAEAGQTGKFGLGFKSVYSICREPIIKSGDIQFKIIAGLYPELLATADASCSDKTIIELKCVGDANVDSIFGHFKKNLELAVLFTKCINDISIAGQVRCVPEYGKYLIQDEKLCVQYVACNNKKYLYVESTEGFFPFKLLFKRNNETNRIEPFPDDNFEIARVWNFNPLDVTKRLPFAVNAPFVVDMGRNNLGRKNELIFDTIASNTAAMLKRLYEVDRDAFAQILDLMYKASNIQINNDHDGYFAKMAQNVLRRVFTQMEIISSGYGTVIPLSAARKLLVVSSSNNTNRDVEYLEKLQEMIDCMGVGTAGHYIITSNARDRYRDAFRGDLFVDVQNLSVLFTFFASNISPDYLNMLMGLFALLNSRGQREFWWALERSAFKFRDASENWWSYYNLNLGIGGYERKYSPHPDYSKEQIAFLASSDYVQSHSWSDLLTQGGFGNYGFGNDLNSLDEDELSPDDPPEFEPDFDDSDYVDFTACSANDIDDMLANSEEMVKSYYRRLYNDSFYDHENGRIRESLKLEDRSRMPENWCVLLLTGMCQSLNAYDHSEETNRNAIKFLQDNGIITEFCNGVNVQDIYDHFNKIIADDETRLRPFEMLLRLRKLQLKFSDFYGLLKMLHKHPNFSGIELLLQPCYDPALTGKGIDMPSTNRSFKLGMHFLLRELLRNDFWANAEEEKLCKIQRQAFMPRTKIRKLLDLNSRDTTSDTIYTKIQDMGYVDPTLDGTYDILFLQKDK